MGFEWSVPPDIWVDGYAVYAELVRATIYSKCVEFAVIIQNWMRQNAGWDDTCLPDREYLRAEAFRDDAADEIGIRAWYDLELYRSQCGEVPFDWGTRHETLDFSQVGVISIIMPQPQGGQTAVLSDWAEDLWHEIQALFA